jgi:flagellar hook protein FlgE
MMRSLFAAVSGLKNHQTRMDVIGNNIANVNTTGFKKSRVTFQDMMSQTLQGASESTTNLGGTNAKQVGLGMRVAAIDVLHAQGAVQTTDSNTDVMIQGDGFFVVKRGDQTFYTRDGNFDFDTDGVYTNDAGMKVQGIMADANFNINNTSPATDINISQYLTLQPKATTKVEFQKNLDSRTIPFEGLLKVDLTKDPSTVQIVNAKVHPGAQGVEVVVDPGTIVSVSGTGSFTEDVDYVINSANGTVTVLNTDIQSIETYYTYNETAQINNATAGPGTTLTLPSPVGTHSIEDIVSIKDPNGKMLTGSGATPEYSFSGGTLTITNAIAGDYTVVYKVKSDPPELSPTLTEQTTPAYVPAPVSKVVELNAARMPITEVQVKAGSTPLAESDYVVDYDAGTVTFTAVPPRTYEITYRMPDIYKKTNLSGKPDQVIKLDTQSLPVKDVKIVNSVTGDVVPDSAYVVDRMKGTITMLGSQPIDPADPTQGYNYVSGDYTITAEEYDAVTSCDIYDSKGKAYIMSVYYYKTENPNEWAMEVSVQSRLEYDNDGGPAEVVLTSPGVGTVRFDPLTGKPVDVNMPQVQFKPIEADPVDITINFDQVVEYAGDTTATLATQDGYQMGDAAEINIDQNGTISISFTNEITKNVARLVMATFNNPSGLVKQGGNLYGVSSNSGPADTGVPGTSTRGTIVSSALEMSNVDLAGEMTDMIITQRGFQSNSRVITVSDSMLEELINLKR